MRLQVVTLLALTLVLSTTATRADWPQFRGPSGQSRSTAEGLPLQWSETESVAWKVAVEGTAWSSPVVLGRQIWMTTALPTLATPEETTKKLQSISAAVPNPLVARSVTLKAVCIDRDTGQLMQSVTLFEVDDPPQICRANSFASPTPVIEPRRLYCDFGTMGTVCIDTANGKPIWTRRLSIKYDVGAGSSLTLHGGLLLVVRDGCDQQYVTALDKNTGESVWKTDRPPIDAPQTPYKKAFSTPLLIDDAGTKQMVVLGAQWIVSYDPDSGKTLWRVNTGPTFSNSSSPAYGHGLVFVCTAFGGSRLLAVKIDGRGDVTDSHVAWSERRKVPRMSSPLLVGDELYTVSDGGVATCFDAHTGEIQWAERILSSCSASPVLADDRIYFFAEDGRAAVVRPGRTFTRLAENQLDGRIKASAAIADGALFIRTDTQLYRIED